MSYILSKTCQNCPSIWLARADGELRSRSGADPHVSWWMCGWGGVKPHQSAAAMCQTCSLFCGVPFILLACFVFTSCWPTLRSWSNPPGSFHGWLGWSTLLCLSLIRISDSRRRSLKKRKRKRKKQNRKNIKDCLEVEHMGVMCIVSRVWAWTHLPGPWPVIAKTILSQCIVLLSKAIYS